MDHLETLKKNFFFEKCKILQNFAKFCKIAYLWGKFSPRRRQVGQNLMRWLGKEIFHRFWISNQIFHTIYDSRDIERSLDPTLAVFGENLNFMDEYLENGLKFWPAVFCVCSVSFSSTFWSLKTKIVRAVSEKIAKKPPFWPHFRIFCRVSIFFGKSGRVTFFTLSMSNIMQSFKKIVRAVFEKNM